MNRFNKFGCRQFYLILNHKKNTVKAYFNDIEKNYSVNYVEEEKPLEQAADLAF